HVRDGRYMGTKASPDDAIEHDLPELRQRCVELYRGNTVAHAAVEGRVTHEVGTGIKYHPCVRENALQGIDKDRAAAINDQLKDVCRRWSEHGVDKRRRLSLAAVQRLVCRTYAIYGEAFVMIGQAKYRGSIGLTLDVISPERVETPPEFIRDPKVRMGIRYNENDEILGYYVRESHPDETGLRYSIEYRYVPRFDSAGHERMIHVFDPVFPEQSRGIPWMAAGMNRAKDLDDFFEAELIAKQIEAAFGLIFEGGEDAPDPHSVAEGNASMRSGGKRLEDVEPGFIHYAQNGEQVKVVDPSRPGSTFAPFIEASLRSFAAAINFPYETLAKNFFRTTFSSGRLAMLDGWMAFAMRQQVIIEQFLVPVGRRVAHEAVFVGEMEGLIDAVEYLDRPHVFDRHRWTGQGRGFIDPDKEVRAHVRANEAGIETKATICGEKGEDWEDTEEQLDREERKRAELRMDREVWENEQRESRGLPPLQRQYDENIGGAKRTTGDLDAETDADEPEPEVEGELVGASG
ncbi:MAG: phage portal protein, partial [Planctomycetota bacterium]